MQTEYRGHTIFFGEHNEQFSVDHGDMQFKHASISKVKKYIDTYYKKKVKSVRVYKMRHRDVSVLWVTSINERGEVWTKDASGYRNKEWSHNDLFAYADPTNRKLIPQIKKLQAQRKKLEAQIEKLKKQLVPFDAKKYSQKQEDKANGKA